MRVMRASLVSRAAAVPAIVLLSLGLGAGVVGAAVTHEKTIEHGATETFVDTFPCVGADFTITTVYNEQTHVTVNGDSFHFTFTQTGTFNAVPVAGGETFSGRFTVWGGGNANTKQSIETFTFNLTGTGSAGTFVSAHENAHVVTDGPGDPEDPATPVKVAFDKMVCH